MKIFYNILKYIYYILTIFVGVFFLQGELLFGDNYLVLLQYVLPGYLLVSWVMIGSVLSTIILTHVQDEKIIHNTRIKYFVIGLMIGVILALAYIFMA